MTITLIPEIEARLCERAARDGRDMEALVNALLADHLLNDEAAREEAADQAMLAAGLLTHIPPPRDPSEAERPVFEVQGEPLSETILREREATASEEEKKTAFHQSMLAAGLLTHIKPPRTAEDSERPIFEVQGEPLSETIMRERR